MFLRLLAAGALTAGGTEEAPELAHHVREGGIVAWYGRSGQHLRQGVQHLVDVVVVIDVDVDVVTEVDVVDVVVRGCEGVFLSTHHLLLTTRTENRPGDLSLSLSTENCVLDSAWSQVLCLRCGGVGVSRGRPGGEQPSSVPRAGPGR